MITYRMYVVESDEMVSLSRYKEGYGVLPLPMADKDTQEDYVSYVQDQVLSFGIPDSMVGNDLTCATVFLEGFAWISYRNTAPAYREKALTKKYIVDARSEAMIEIIDSHVIVDPVNVYYGTYFNFHTGTLRTVYAGADVSELLISKGGYLESYVQNLNSMLQNLDKNLINSGYPNSGVLFTEVSPK